MTHANHAKVGVAKDVDILVSGDMNQEGALTGPDCSLSQNARGGLFFILRDPTHAARDKED